MRLIADASNNQAVLNMPALARVVDGLVHKVSQGTGYVDPYMVERRAAASRCRLPFGGYHFAGYADTHGTHFGSPAEEAATFLEHYSRLADSDLLPALDLEIGDPSTLGGWAVEWNRAVYHELGVWPLIYSYGDFLARLRWRGRPLARPIGNGLWLASYARNDGVDHPYMVPAPWRKARLHQFTSVGKLAGETVKLDLSHADRLPFAHPLKARLHGFKP